MGNSISKKYQNFYLDSMFTTIQDTRDKLIGNYNIIQFHNEKDIFMVTTLDPSLYHHYTDVELFKKKFSKTSSYLSTFLFVEMNKDKNDQFDFIFEFGDFFKNVITGEKRIIGVLNNLLESLIELEEKNLHYPKLDKKYVIVNSFGKIKLLNPLCFYEFLEDLTNVYINPNVSDNHKNLFSKKKLIENKNDFLKFVLSLFTRINFDLFRKSELFKKNFFSDLEKHFSENFLRFLKSLSEKNISSFREIKKILNGKNIYKKNINFESKNFSNNSNNTNKRYSIDTRTSRQSNTQNRFSLARKQRNNYDSHNINNNINQLENPYKQNYQSNTNDFNPYQNTPEKNIKNLSPPQKKRNLFKKEINTPTALNYNKKNNHHKKNIKSFSDYTSNNELFNNIDLNKIDSLKNLNPIDENIENDYYKETIKKKLFRENSNLQKKKMSRKSSLEKTLKKSKSKVFFNKKNPEPPIDKNHFKMILNNKQILFEHHIKNIFNYFNSINGIVNRSDPQKPSMYHNVEKFPLNKRKKKFTNINKYYQKVSLKNLDNLNSFNNFDKFNTKENYFVGIDKKKIGRRLSEKRVIKRYNSSNNLKGGSVSRRLFEDKVNVMGIRGRRF